MIVYEMIIVEACVLLDIWLNYLFILKSVISLISNENRQ